jgi:hypothetical protein
MWFDPGLHASPNKKAVNILNIMMSTIQFMEYELAHIVSKHADVCIHPIVHEAHWAEFYSSHKFIQMGESKTEQHLEEIKKLIAES